MGRAQSLEIDGYKFARKADALAFMKVMLNRYSPGDTVDEADARFLAEALSRHPEARGKIGSGLRRFEVRAAKYGTQCFWIIRSDGSEEDFSYKKCV